MRITDFLTPERIFLDVRTRGKPRLLAEVARNFARSDPSIDATAVEAALLAREQLGSTGLGAGFALPHARIENLQTFQGMFLRLQKPIEFDAIDDTPVSMIFVLLIPNAENVSHVGALAVVSRTFRENRVMEDLRRATTADGGYKIFLKP